MITKKDNNELVTKKDFREEMKNVDKRFNEVDKRFDEVDKRFNYLKEYVDYRFDEFEKNIFEVMYTKKDHEIFMRWMDEAMTELRDSRDERNLYERQKLRMDDKVANHELRITALEEKVN
jgi:hypothetical protein